MNSDWWPSGQGSEGVMRRVSVQPHRQVWSDLALRDEGLEKLRREWLRNKSARQDVCVCVCVCMCVCVAWGGN